MEKNIAIYLGKNISTIRREIKKTQAEIAEKVGIDTVSLSRIERGNVTPSIATLSRIANALDTTLGRLFDGISPGTKELSDRIAYSLETLPERKRLFLLEQMARWAEWLSKE